MAELVDRHNPTERQLRFREEYQAQIHPLYSGPVHIAVIYAVGLDGDRLVRLAPAGRDLGMAARRPGVLLLEPVRVVDPQERDAPAGGRVGAARDLRPPHAPAPPVLHRQRDDGRHDARVAHHLLPVARAVHVHGARDAVRARARLAGEPERRLHPDGHDRRPVPDLRDVPLLLPRARQLRSCATCRSSTRSVATTPRTTTTGS